MEILRLDQTSYLPDSLVEGYSSMIWTERKLDFCEFEMRTAKVEETKSLIPENSLISHLDTEEVMVVESHSIENDDNGVPQLTVKGRSFHKVIEDRVLTGSLYQEEWQALRQYTPAEAVSMLLWNYLANDTGQDPSIQYKTKDIWTKIPNLVVTNSAVDTGDLRYWWLKEGELAQTVQDFLGLGGLGVRTIRPTNTSANIVSVDSSSDPALRGTVSKALISNVSDIQIDVYNGIDRTRNQPFVEPVVFDYSAGDIDAPKYFFSSKNLKTIAVVSSSLGINLVWPGFDASPATPEPSGLEYRALYVDGGTKDPDVLDSDFLNSLTQKALIELSKHNRSTLFDGAISPISMYKYKEDYFLGDKVTLSAEYGFEASMEVVEYVRTEDQTGDRGYPTLVLATS